MRPAQQLATAASQLDAYLGTANIAKRLEQPLIILAAPRSGSTLLFEQLQKIAGFWSIGGESHIIYASLPHLRFENQQIDSGALNESHADPSTSAKFRAALLYLAKNHLGLSYGESVLAQNNTPITLLEKTPRNALCVPFLKAIFPKARFVYLYREAKPNIASIASAWLDGQSSGRFVTYPQLADFDERKWCFLLPAGWRHMKHKSYVNIAAFQWCQANLAIINSLRGMPNRLHMSVSYESLISKPADTIKSIIDFCGLAAPNDLLINSKLALSRTTLTPPNAEKWKHYEAEINALLATIADTEADIRDFLAEEDKAASRRNAL